jgi:hypothetical protein
MIWACLYKISGKYKVYNNGERQVINYNYAAKREGKAEKDRSGDQKVTNKGASPKAEDIWRPQRWPC